jgi:NADPH:quinone reductase-like Zn-dependent oxidoreductase
LAVLGRPWGTAAEYTVFPARQAVPPPGNASFAHRALLSDGPRFVEVALGPNLKLDLAVSGPETVVVTYTADGHRPFTLSVICDVHLQMGL